MTRFLLAENIGCQWNDRIPLDGVILRLLLALFALTPLRAQLLVDTYAGGVIPSGVPRRMSRSDSSPESPGMHPATLFSPTPPTM